MEEPRILEFLAFFFFAYRRKKNDLLKNMETYAVIKNDDNVSLQRIVS